MKKYIFVFALFCTSHSNAQIPVTDGASISQTALEFVQTAARFTQEVSERAAQLSQLQAEFNSITGTRNLGAIFDNPLLKQSLPAGWSAAMDSVNTGGYAGMSAITAAEYNQIFDACTTKVGQAKINCEGFAVQGAQNKAVAKAGIANTDLRLTQLDQLMAQINSTTDAKGIQELTARISIEQARIATDKLKHEQYVLAAKANREVLHQQRKETRQQEINSFVLTPLPSTSFTLF